MCRNMRWTWPEKRKRLSLSYDVCSSSLNSSFRNVNSVISSDVIFNIPVVIFLNPKWTLILLYISKKGMFRPRTITIEITITILVSTPKHSNILFITSTCYNYFKCTSSLKSGGFWLAANVLKPFNNIMWGTDCKQCQLRYHIHNHKWCLYCVPSLFISCHN